MNFATFDLNFWYTLSKDKYFNFDNYKIWLDKIQDIGFTHIVVDDLILPKVIEEISNRNIGIHLSILCSNRVIDKDSSHYHVEPWRSDQEFITHDKFMDNFYERYISIYKDSIDLIRNINNEIIVSINPATFLESTFYLDHYSYIMNGNLLKIQEEMLKILETIGKSCYDIFPTKQLLATQIIGFGAENKQRYDLDGISICKRLSENNNIPFIYCTPTQCSHDSKYLATNILYQNGLKKQFNISLAWGAMGILGFPVTVPMAYFNNIDEVFMFTNELEYDRMTRVGFYDVSDNNVGLIKDIIKAVNNCDEDFLKKIMVSQSKRFYRSSGENISDEHFSLEELG